MGKAEILHEIKIAEEQVRAMTREAEEKRKQLQADGKRMALQKTDASESAQRKKLEAETADAQARTNLRKRVLLEEGQKRAEALTASARKRMPEAKEFVLTEFERAVDA